jgi:hypothetical protein
VAQEELPEPVTGTHPVKARVLPGANKITQRLKLGRGHEDRRQEPARVQSSEPAGVTLIGLHPITRSAGSVRLTVDVLGWFI